MLFARIGGSLFVLLLATALPAQTTPPATPQHPAGMAATPTPNDPAERLNLGRKLNGLTGPDAKPWHLKATYQLYDEKGNPAQSGAFEEWWFNDRRYKVAYHDPAFSQEEYSIEHGVFRSGDQQWPEWPLSLLRDAIESPIPVADELKDLSLHNLTRTIGPVQLDCTALSIQGEKEFNKDSPSYCFEPSNAILRSSNTIRLFHQTLYNQISTFQGRFVARDVHLLFVGLKSLTIHIDTLELLSADQASSIAPPAEPQPGLRRIVYLASWSDPVSTNVNRPKYPEQAKKERISGITLVIIHVGINGHVMDASAVAGPEALRKASVDAARGLVYKPRLSDGQPVEFELEIENTFALGG
ncbi:MAG TPA: energy transducer TonB [Terracidiphilus sp.]|jgi:hypothetical protein|nr:energy transducer TonB [Terracidiphilus sp.]